MQHSDHKYIIALLNNDRQLIEEIYSKYSPKIKEMVLKNNGYAMDAKDIFQDALISIHNKAKEQAFVLTCPFDALIYLYCKNKWLKELDKRGIRRVTFLDSDGYNNLGEDSFKLAEACLLKVERRALLMEKLAELGESCQQLLHLSWDGHSMEEVADMLHVTYGYARKKKSECMAKLIALIKQSPRFDSLQW